MKKYRRLKSVLAAILGGTLALGLVSAVRPAGEIFPFASWFLFSLVPQRVTSYDMLVRSWGEQRFDPPTPLNEVEGLLGSPRSSTVFQLVQRYGRAEEAGDRAEAEVAWRLLQPKFTSAAPVTFELVKRSYDPVDRSRGGRVEQIRIETETRAPDASISPAGGSR